MILNEALTKDDISLIRNYLQYYADYECGVCDTEYWLRYWERSKKTLYHIFGEKTILEQEVKFEKSSSELHNEMEKECWSYATPSYYFLDRFRDYFFNFYYNDRGLSNAEYSRIAQLITTDTLVKNIYDGDTFEISEQFTQNGKSITVPSGCKVSKILGKIAKACGMNEAHYEEFRRAHSRALNQKTTMGTLCLSIHPMDYITMSDNDCGWSSCMAWVEEHGDYRIGTIEMMNSPYVVVAYLKAKNDMCICDGMAWNSKRWRQLIIVTPEMILGNKMYPYENDTLQGIALKWMRTLCEKAGYGHYEQEAFQIRNNCSNTIGTRSVYFDIYTHFMYNDIYDHRMAFLNIDKLPEKYLLGISGAAVCTCCGCMIEDGNECGTSKVVCNMCSHEFYCDVCGEWCDGEQHYVEDRCICSYCYENETITCECCGDICLDYKSVPIVVGRPNEGENYDDFNYEFSVYVCYDCYCNEEKLKEIYGGLQEVPSRWIGGTRKVFFIEDIADWGLKGEAYSENFTFLKTFRDAKTYEERMEIFENRYDYY